MANRKYQLNQVWSELNKSIELIAVTAFHYEQRDVMEKVEEKKKTTILDSRNALMKLKHTKMENLEHDKWIKSHFISVDFSGFSFIILKKSIGVCGPSITNAINLIFANCKAMATNIKWLQVKWLKMRRPKWSDFKKNCSVKNIINCSRSI